MSRIAAQEREDVDLDARGSMTTARKRRLWEAAKQKCWMCGQPVPMEGPDVRYDHKTPLELGGADEDWNIFPLHRDPCDRLKTAADAQRIAKMRRQRSKLRLDQPRTVSPAWGKSKGFGEPVRVPAGRKR